MKHRVAITGTGVVSVLGDSSSEVFDALCKGRTGLDQVGPFVPGGFPCHLAGQLLDFQPEKYLKGRPLRPVDRTSQLTSAACGLALENSGWNAESRLGLDFALVVGTMFSGMHTIGDFDRTAITAGPASVSPMAFANTVISAAAGQTAIWHNLRGPNSTVATGSISGISAVGHAFDLIRRGNSKAILAGGVDEFSVESFCGFGRAGLLCTNGTHPECPVPFDARRNGFALGEGAGFLALEEFAVAAERGARVLAEIKGYATAFDCSQGNDPDLAVRTVTRTMRTAIERSGTTIRGIDFVSASANGSVARDCFELAALASLFGGQASDLPVTAVKSGTGEALAASGPLQLAMAIETFQTGKLPGVIGLRELPPASPLRGISANPRLIKARTALINGIGLDGNCCSLVIALVN
jgi:3-oxoacyl-[acyl-carrier-protein] synthase II